MFRQSRVQTRKLEAMATWDALPEQAFQALSITRQQAKDMQSQFTGTLVWPWDPTYNDVRGGFNPAYKPLPQVVALCANISDVALCLGWARQYAWQIACRSGGHSTAGYCGNNNGIIIDLKSFNYVLPDVGGRRVRVGVGTPFGSFNAVMNFLGMHTPGGGCDDVCIGGYMQGGGYGFTSREFGMNCDNVLEFTMILADGRYITVTETNEYQDLFYAVRGGMGNNFGVVLDVTYRMVPLGELWGFKLTWDIQYAPQVLAELQQNYMRSGASNKLGYMAGFMYEPTTNRPVMLVFGMYHGIAVEGRIAIQSLLEIGSPEFASQMGTYITMNQFIMPVPNFPASATEGPAGELVESGYIDRPLSKDEWQTMVNQFLTSLSQDGNYSNALWIEPYGGAISAYPVEKSAFIHRAVDMCIHIDSFWFADGSQDQAEAWLNQTIKTLTPMFNGQQYQNYPHRTVTDYKAAYWGDAYNTLLSIANKYDPTPLFYYPQGLRQGGN